MCRKKPIPVDENPPTQGGGKSKKKSSKSKKNKAASAFGDEDITELGQPSVAGGTNETEANNIKDSKVNHGREEVVETSKNKEKKKKSGLTAQEEDDLNTILAELGKAPPVAQATAPPPQIDNAQVQAEPVGSTEVKDDKMEAEIETWESAAAKKKKKKKEERKRKRKESSSNCGFNHRSSGVKGREPRDKE